LGSASGGASRPGTRRAGNLTPVPAVLAGLVRHSKDSILAVPGWKPSLGKVPGQFGLPDLLRLAGVLAP